MTPEEHIARAEDLARGAAALRSDYLKMGGTVHRTGSEGTELLAEMQALATLALTHATLATAVAATGTPGGTEEILDYDGKPEELDL